MSKKVGHYVGQAAASLVLIAALLGSYAAHAGQILSDTATFEGTSAISESKYTIALSGPGMLSVDLTDEDWPNSSLADLSVALTTATGVIGQITGAGQQSFNIVSGGTFYAYVTGEATNPASGPDYGLGMYNLTIGFTPSTVRLPASLGLLLAGLLGFALLQVRFRPEYRFLSAPPQSA
jgi:hypothetical protein